MSDLQEEERRGGERRSDERRSDERREGDRRGRDRRHDPRGVRVATSHGSRQNITAALWALTGAVVVVYLFFLVLGNTRPRDSPAIAIVVLVLAVLWLAHSWRRLLAGGAISTGDRERRGF